MFFSGKKKNLDLESSNQTPTLKEKVINDLVISIEVQEVMQ